MGLRFNVEIATTIIGTNTTEVWHVELPHIRPGGYMNLTLQHQVGTTLHSHLLP